MHLGVKWKLFCLGGFTIFTASLSARHVQAVSAMFRANPDGMESFCRIRFFVRIKAFGAEHTQTYGQAESRRSWRKILSGPKGWPGLADCFVGRLGRMRTATSRAALRAFVAAATNRTVSISSGFALSSAAHLIFLTGAKIITCQKTDNSRFDNRRNQIHAALLQISAF
jgi:hypothetical protein